MPVRRLSLSSIPNGIRCRLRASSATTLRASGAASPVLLTTRLGINRRHIDWCRGRIAPIRLTLRASWVEVHEAGSRQARPDHRQCMPRAYLLLMPLTAFWRLPSAPANWLLGVLVPPATGISPAYALLPLPNASAVLLPIFDNGLAGSPPIAKLVLPLPNVIALLKTPIVWARVGWLALGGSLLMPSMSMPGLGPGLPTATARLPRPALVATASLPTASAALAVPVLTVCAFSPSETAR